MIHIGRHFLHHGDITLGAVERLMGTLRADVIYSDPPWGPGNQRYWHTINAKGSLPRTSWNNFLMAFCTACSIHSKLTAPVFVEMGLRWVEQLDEQMQAIGLMPRRRWTTSYGSKRHLTTLSLYGKDVEVSMPDPPHGENVTMAALKSVIFPGAVVLDPCTGLGMTARITHKLGGTFYGTELNEKRLERTATWLRSHLGS